jgi:PPM family protein phosphatase
MTDSNGPIRVDVFGQTDVGLIRENNEDSFLIADPTSAISAANGTPWSYASGERGSLLLVADGMGGVEAGEVASRMAVDLVAGHFFDHLSRKSTIDQRAFVNALSQSVHEANRIVFQEGSNDSKRKGMGTTLTAAAVCGAAVFFAQLGDSRAYLFRNGLIGQMTKDQSLVAQLVAAGSLTPQEAKTHPQRNVILQALGVRLELDVIISFASLKRGDQLVLCSDGLSGKVEAEEIRELLDKRLDSKEACRRLVQLARERGGEDNITVIVARFNGAGLPEPEPDDAPVYRRFHDKARRRFWPWPY